MKFGIAFVVLALVACSVQAAKTASKKHTVVAIVVKHNKGKNGAATVHLDGQTISAIPVKAAAPVVPVATQPIVPFKPAPVPQNTLPLQAKPLLAPRPAPVPAPIPQNTQPLLAKPAPLNTKDLPQIKIVIQKDKPSADKKEKKKNDFYKEHKKLYPCHDYSPICKYYHIQAPNKKSIAQCRDVWMQRNCRKTCGLCKVPWGAFLGCNDMENCKKMSKHRCIHEWVKATCRAKCGVCSPFERAGSSSVHVGKKKANVPKQEDQEEDKMDEASGAENDSVEAKEEDDDEEAEAEAEEQEEDENAEDSDNSPVTGDEDALEEPEMEGSASGSADDESKMDKEDSNDKKEDKKQTKEETKKTTKQKRMVVSTGDSL